MPCSASEVQIETLLNQLIRQLKSAEQWSVTPPNEWAMQSEAPFACDRMDFAQWLQFIFIPKMTSLLQAKLPLPERMTLLPMAQEWAKELKCDGQYTTAILGTISKIDLIFSDAPL
ncbi:YqcC family protein [Paraglaciecola mesophila]|nr:YqcC family protein [Paraglaciecola mesophila]